MAVTELPGQFLVTDERVEAPSGWATRDLRTLMLATAPGLTVTPVVHGVDGECSWLVGTVIRDGARLDTQPLVLAQQPRGALAAVLELLPTLAGRHVAIVEAEKVRRLYLDAAGTRSVVYAPDDRRAASTPAALLGDAYEERYDHALAAQAGMPDADHWYPSGLTAHTGVHRLLPHHHLDLSTWTAQRHWPVAGPPPRRDPVDVVPELAGIVRGTLEAASVPQGAHLSLTAGQDARLLLACTGGGLDAMRFFTFVARERSPDPPLARRLATRFGLALDELRVVEGDAEQDGAWLWRTGHAVSGAIRRIHPTLAKLDPARMVMPGMAGEVARAYYWAEGDEHRVRLEAGDLLARMHLPAAPRFVDATARWLEPLDGLPVSFVLDLAYIEQRLGCWSGPQSYGSDPYGDSLIPLAQRRIFELMLSLPESYRREQRLAIDVCRHAWLELLELPFNRYLGAERARAAVVAQARRIPRAPQRLARVLRAGRS